TSDRDRRRTAHEPGGRESPRDPRAPLEKTKGKTRRGRGGDHLAGLPRSMRLSRSTRARRASVRTKVKKLFVLLLVVILAAGAAVAIQYHRVWQPYRGFEGAEQFVDIPQGAGSRAIGERLIEAGVIRDQVTYRAALWLTGDGRHLKAGEYRFDRPMTPIQVIDKIARGDVYVIHITFPEGLTMFDMAKLFESHGLGQAKSFLDVAKDPAPIRELDPAARTLEGYLYPETYALSRHADARLLVKQMVAQFQ